MLSFLKDDLPAEVQKADESLHNFGRHCDVAVNLQTALEFNCAQISISSATTAAAAWKHHRESLDRTMTCQTSNMQQPERTDSSTNNLLVVNPFLR